MYFIRVFYSPAGVLLRNNMICFRTQRVERVQLQFVAAFPILNIQYAVVLFVPDNWGSCTRQSTYILYKFEQSSSMYLTHPRKRLLRWRSLQYAFSWNADGIYYTLDTTVICQAGFQCQRGTLISTF